MQVFVIQYFYNIHEKTSEYDKSNRQVRLFSFLIYFSSFSQEAFIPSSFDFLFNTTSNRSYYLLLPKGFLQFHGSGVASLFPDLCRMITG